MHFANRVTTARQKQPHCLAQRLPIRTGSSGVQHFTLKAVVRRTSKREPQRALRRPFHHEVGHQLREPDRVLDSVPLQILVELRLGKRRITTKENAGASCEMPLDGRSEHLLPVFGRRDVAGPQLRSFAVTPLIEEEERRLPGGIGLQRPLLSTWSRHVCEQTRPVAKAGCENSSP